MVARDYILGIDISHHNGPVDHLQVADSGMRFCICKATEGRTHVDSMFHRHMKAIRDVRKPGGGHYWPGAYHFARPDTDGGSAPDGEAEANHFCDVVEDACGDIREDFMPPVLDFEKYSESDERENIPWIESWIMTVERRLGRKPMIYTGANIWRYEVGNTANFADLPLWQVFYSGKASAPPAMPWSRWSLWQFSGSTGYQHHGSVPGVDTVCDVNRWHGTIESLALFANSKEPGMTPKIGHRCPGAVHLANEPAPSTAVRRVQALLLAHGHDPGLMDGHWGPRTAGALRAWQVAAGRPTGPILGGVDWLALAFSGIDTSSAIHRS